MKYTVFIMFEVTADSPNEAVDRAVSEFVATVNNPEDNPPLLVNVVENTDGIH